MANHLNMTSTWNTLNSPHLCWHSQDFDAAGENANEFENCVRSRKLSVEWRSVVPPAGVFAISIRRPSWIDESISSAYNLFSTWINWFSPIALCVECRRIFIRVTHIHVNEHAEVIYYYYYYVLAMQKRCLWEHANPTNVLNNINLRLSSMARCHVCGA